jgi:hypothetical protein
MKGLIGFARRSLGLQLHPGQVAVLKEWELSGKRKAQLVLGRRSGKGLLAAIAALHNAVVEDYDGYLRPGEARYILVVATRQEQAQAFVQTVRELLEQAPDHNLSALVDQQASSAEQVTLRTGSGNVIIRAMPCSARAIRGLPASLIVMDEAAHFVTETEGFQAARAVWRALSPSLAQFGAKGYAMITSTPLWPSGWFYDSFTAGESGADPALFVVRKPTWEMRDAAEGIVDKLVITRESLDGEFAADPEGARVEYGAEFLGGIGAFLDATNVFDCAIPGRQSLPPLEGVSYVGVCDPAFAAGGDSFAFAVAHLVGQGDSARVVIDRLESWRGKNSPLNSDVVLDEIAVMAHEYHLRELISDQFASVPLADGLRRRGVTMKAQALSNELKHDIFLTLKRLINLARIELPDRSDLSSELLSLELRPTPSGKPRIAAVGRRHDDLAMVVATAAHALLRKRPSLIVAPAGVTGRSVWLSEGQDPSELAVAAASQPFNATTKFGVDDTPPTPPSKVPAGTICGHVNRDGVACNSERFHEDGRCIRCDHRHSSGISAGPGTPMPPLMLKSR